MNKRGRKTNGLSHRLIALLLCCVCLVTVLPLSAIALAPDETAAAAEEVAPEEPAVDIAEEPEAPDAEEPDAEPEEDSSEQRAVDALYRYLMACTSYEEMDAAINALSEDELYLMDQFTAEQNAALEARMQELGGYASDVYTDRTVSIEQGGSTTVGSTSWITKVTIAEVDPTPTSGSFSASSSYWNSGYTITADDDVPAGTYTLTVNVDYRENWSSSTTKTQTDTVTVSVTKPAADPAYTFTVTPNLTNVELVYFTYHTASDVTDNIDFKEAPDGQAVSIENFSKGQSGYVLFFVKPDANYLLTQATGTGNGDVYSTAGTNASDYGNISGYPNIVEIAKQAREKGYIGVLGYMRTSNDKNSMTHTLTLTGQSPDIEVTAVSDKTENVKPGDNLTFTVTIKPGEISNSSNNTSNAKVDKVAIDSLQINGKDVTYSDLRDNGDGTYTVTVNHTATQEECDNGSVELTVTAKVDYSNALGVNDGQTLDSTSSITKSASTTCRIAPQIQVSYRLTYQNADKIDYENYPDAVKKKPENKNGVYWGAEVEVENNFYESTTVDDPINHGTWTFGGWYYDGSPAPDSVTMGNTPIEFVGTWTFTPYPNANLIITKTLSGNMYNENDEFTFTVTADKAMTYNGTDNTKLTFNLKKDQRATISVPVGAEVTISEKPDGYNSSLTSITPTELKGDGWKNDQITFTMPSEGVEVVINNDKTITIDAGVVVSTLPYVLMLAVVVGGVTVTVTRRKHRREN